MNDQQCIIKIEQIITPLLNSENIELIEIELKGAIGNQLLRIFVDVEGGIQLNHCVELSRKISDLLDIEDIIPGKYRLEVSSPGVERPLKTVKDFQRNEGRRVRITFHDGITTEGNIFKTENSDVYINSADTQEKYPISAIKSAKLMLQW